jgi:hypothetical protein
MKVFLIGFFLLSSIKIQAENITFTIKNYSSTNLESLVKSQLLALNTTASRKGWFIEDTQSLKCLDLGNGYSAVGSCVISGDMGEPNSSSRFLINVSHPNAFQCDYETTKLTMTFLDSEC